MAAANPIVLYLDHGDLSTIADGKAADSVSELQAALSRCGGNILVSSAHLLDLARADAGTRKRWVNALSCLATVQFAAEPGDGIVVDETKLTELLRETDELVGKASQVFALKQDAELSARSAHLAQPSHIDDGELKRIVAAILDGNVADQLELDPVLAPSILAGLQNVTALLKDSGMDRADILSALLPQRETNLMRGDLAGVVRADRTLDRHRKPRFSDTTDELHLKFAVHADIVTADKNVAHSLKRISGQSIPVGGRRASRANEIHVLPTGNLHLVAKTIRVLSRSE